jgi:exopolysaccharide production protein ExoQ
MVKRIEWVFAVLVLVFYAGLLTPSEAAEGGHDLVMRQVSIYAQTIVIPFTLFLVLANWRRMIAGIRATLLPVAIASSLFLSTAWSIEPHITLRRSLIFIFTTVFALYIGAALSRSRQLRLYATVSLISVVGCFLIAIFFPTYGISMDSHLGEWKGLFQHKNALGRQMVFTIALFLSGRPFRSTYLSWITLAGALALLFLSRSGTGLFGFGAVLIGFVLVKLIRVRDRKTLPLWIALLPFGIICGAAAFVLRNELFALIGKDATLTGRTFIWAFAFENMAHRPLLGHGYAVFWRQTIVGQTMPQGLAATHAHDGFFDVILDSGFLGLALLLVTLVSYLSLAGKRVLNQKIPLTNFSVFAFLYLFLFISLNLTESNLYREHTFLWLPFVSIYTAMSLQEVEEKREREEASRLSHEEMAHQLA